MSDEVYCDEMMPDSQLSAFEKDENSVCLFNGENWEDLDDDIDTFISQVQFIL